MGVVISLVSSSFFNNLISLPSNRSQNRLDLTVTLKNLCNMHGQLSVMKPYDREISLKWNLGFENDRILIAPFGFSISAGFRTISIYPALLKKLIMNKYVKIALRLWKSNWRK